MIIARLLGYSTRGDWADGLGLLEGRDALAALAAQRGGGGVMDACECCVSLWAWTLWGGAFRVAGYDCSVARNPAEAVPSGGSDARRGSGGVCARDVWRRYGGADRGAAGGAGGEGDD